MNVNSLISEVLSAPQTLIIEEDSSAPEPVVFLSHEDASQPDIEMTVCDT